ncbi:unnamed protein product [Brassicogethes aeneus]|uniref:Uncharacterized protein n=1 Tax=Brassicogethes aeneus TaxID=1431903 RepID=A0A9P0B302_BRAAE|nr:unnamed protein product [Brassicogethes aeneus]
MNKKYYITLLTVSFLVFVITKYKPHEHPQVKVVKEYIIQKVSYENTESIKTVNKMGCYDKPLDQKIYQRGEYWVMTNYIKPKMEFHCHESITYTTHGDFQFLDNLPPLVERWLGPVSIALHAPGDDFKDTLESMLYFRECTSNMIREYVSFHVYFHNKHLPKEIPSFEKISQLTYDCKGGPPIVKKSSQMYKTKKNLLYPVNVGRNIAREAAQTHYIFASDIELYPSPNIIPKFLAMIEKNEGPLQSKNKVFPIPIFEIKEDQAVPETKTALQGMLRKKTAIPFHKFVCSWCHNIPKAREWEKAAEGKNMEVFHVAKRQGPYKSWEPIYIGTNDEPLYDERLSWEGKRDKMTQGYVLCVKDYDFLILNNAFLVHRPGIKKYHNDPGRNKISSQTNRLIGSRIFPEIKRLYGSRKGCIV